MAKTISAREAAALLGVSPATLYSYVSRGLLASSGESGARARRYAHDDVLRLAARRGDGKRAGHAVAAAMSWGVPVLETRIAHIDGGRLFYRGVDACVLAESAPLEQAAQLLWQPWLAGQRPVPAAAAMAEAAHTAPAVAAPDRSRPELAAAGHSGPATALLAATAALPPLPRAMALLPVLADEPPAGSPMPLLQLNAALLLGTAPCATPLHEQAAQAWNLKGAAVDLLRAALVLLADHELNNSTFTVRCAASAGAALPAVLCAGMAALSGSEHGGHYLVAKAVLQRAAAAPDTQPIRQMTPGFGHPLYPDGDVRAAFLLGKLQALAPARYAPYGALARRAAGIPGAQPNSDFALAALELMLDLPHGAALALLAMARTAGWIAHALEQRDDGRMIRPRARYVGEFG